MHFVTGGAFNGKRAWVEAQYPEAHWVSAYRGEIPSLLDKSFIVFEGIEQWVKDDSQELNREKALQQWCEVIEGWMDWEKLKDNRKLIIIGTDISKGIVPIIKEDRFWRDVTGWVYQELVAKANRVDIVWYGINTTIKGDLK